MIIFTRLFQRVMSKHQWQLTCDDLCSGNGTGS